MSRYTDAEAEIIRITGRLVTRVTEAQTARVRQAAAARGWLPTEYLRRRIVPRLRGES